MAGHAEDPTAGSATDGERPAAIEVRGLTKVYDGRVLAVDDISFSVAEGDFCVIIGPSGCGKTTTLHSLVGKVTPTEGRVFIGGEEVTDRPTYERDIGLVFQDFQLFPHLTVEENVRYGLDHARSVDGDLRVVGDTIDLMRLNDVRERLPRELSAGQKQRVALARSLVLRPEVLLLDEPLGDMDYKLQKKMMRELQRVHRELDTTFVYVTHDQMQAMRLGDQLVVMNDGRIEQDGPAAEVYKRPATAFVAAFVGDSNVFTGELVDLQDGGARAVVETPFGSFTTDTGNLSSAPADLRGEELSFVVRPHALSLTEAGENTLTCDVLDVLYQPGSGTQVLLEAAGADGETKDVQAKSPERLDVDADRLAVSWASEDATLLERPSVVPDVDLRTDILGE